MERFWSRVFARFAPPEQQRTDDEFALDVPDAKGDEEVEMTAYEVSSRRFRRQLFGGLRSDEVTTFLDQVAEALHVAQRRHIELEAQLRLLESDVRALGIEQAPVAPSEHGEQKDDAPAASRLQVLRSTALQEVEALLHDAQVRAQALTDAAQERAATIVREADALKSHREREAEQLVAEATVTVESILTTARDQEASLRNELDRLSESRLRMLDDLWATLNGCQEWLASIDPRRRGPEEPEGQLDRVA